MFIHVESKLTGYVYNGSFIHVSVTIGQHYGSKNEKSFTQSYVLGHRAKIKFFSQRAWGEIFL